MHNEEIESHDILQAIHCLKEGKVIAYPTESVYGFGCDPFNTEAIFQILSIKNRSIDKGFILVAAFWEQLEPLLLPIEPRALARVFASWPGPVTWVFPAKPDVPHWMRGKHNSLAVRVSAHPAIQALCRQFQKPIISTSANLDGQPPARDYRTVQMSFGEQLAFIVNGKPGPLTRPTEIRNAITGEIIREG